MKRRIGFGLAAIGFAVCLAGCLFQTEDQSRVEGTGSQGGNAITARVVDEGGHPVAGAQVTLLPSEYLPDSVGGGNGTSPIHEVVAVSDVAGRFTVPAPSGKAYTLEAHSGAGSERLIALKEAIAVLSAKANTDAGDLVLQLPASLSGTILTSKPDSLGASEHLWVGFPGTGNFAKVGSNGDFTLAAVSTNVSRLLAVRSRSTGQGEHYPVEGWRVLPGERAVMDSVVLPSAGTDIQVLACVETVTSIEERQYQGPPVGGRTGVLRTVLSGTSPLLIELDPCLGSWRTLRSLPDYAVAASGSGTDTGSDYLLLKERGQILALNASLGPDTLLPLPTGLLNVEFRSGRIYATFAGDSAVKVYSDLSALLSGTVEKELPLGTAVSDLWDFVLSDSVLYFTAPGDAPPVRAYDLRLLTFSTHGAIPGFTGQFFGIASASGNNIWVLNDKADLILYDPIGRKLLRKLPVTVPREIRGLLRFQESD